MSLMGLLPEYYQNSSEVAEIQTAFSYWTELLKAAHDEVIAQANIETATWGLFLWEKQYGLKADASASDDARREAIMAKMRGQGPTTKDMIKVVAESFTNGEVDVTEYSDEYRFEITFIGAYGIPANISSLSEAIDRIKPAHLAYTYIYTFITWSEVEIYNLTWDAWEALNLTWEQFEVYEGS
jgi:uncharacterized protein YmfQ (DUF2313 family)